MREKRKLKRSYVAGSGVLRKFGSQEDALSVSIFNVTMDNTGVSFFTKQDIPDNQDYIVKYMVGAIEYEYLVKIVWRKERMGGLSFGCKKLN
jgi:hypothetical protein